VEGLNKTTKNLSRNCRSPGRDLNPVGPEYEAGVRVMYELCEGAVTVSFFKVPLSASDALLTTLHPLFEKRKRSNKVSPRTFQTALVVAPPS
jgi:hypothetical protein